MATEAGLPLTWLKPMVLATVEETEESPTEDMFVSDDVDDLEGSDTTKEEDGTPESNHPLDSANVSDDAVVIVADSRTSPDNSTDAIDLAPCKTPTVQQMVSIGVLN